MKVQDIMSKTLSCCAATDTLQRAAQLMKEHDVGAIPVVNDCGERKLLGIITDRDICMKVVAQGNLTSAAKVSEAMTSTPATCGPNDSIEGCESLMKRHQVRRIPVVDSTGVCMGMVSQADIALRDTPEHIKDTLAAVSRHHARPQGQAAVASA
jgi:CBS domain-containing protein